MRTLARRTQQQKSAETQEKLLTATLDALLESGYTRVSTVEIAERAEVSRGGLTHHYAAKEDLIVAAFHKLLTDTTHEIRSFAEYVEKGTVTLEAFVGYLWELFSGPFYFISLEIVVECRHNTPLRSRMIPVIQEFHSALDSIWCKLLRGTQLSPVEISTTLNMTVCLLRGMGMQTVLRPDPPYYERLLAGWQTQLARMIENSDNAGIERSSRIPLRAVRGPASTRKIRNSNQ